MNLRLRLIVAFFLLSVVPLGAVTLYTYTSNASAMRDAASREAELLAGELTERMRLVTAQLSQQFVQLMEIPAAARLQPTAVSTAGSARPSERPSAGAAGVRASSGENTTTSEASAKADEAARVASQLGEVAMLLNNIEVRGFFRGRSGRGVPGQPPPPTSGGPRPGGAPPTAGATPAAEGRPAGAPGGRGSRGAQPPGLGVQPQQDAGGNGATGATAETASRGRGGRTGSDRQSAGRSGDPGALGSPEGRPGGRGGGRFGPPPDDQTQADPSRIQIDLGPVRREILQQMYPNREEFNQLSQAEKEQVWAKVNERVLGIQQGIQMLQQKANEQAAAASKAAEIQESTVGSASSGSQGSRASTRGSSTASARSTPPSAPPPPAPSPAPPQPSTPPAAVAAPAPMQRTTALSGSRMDVRVEQNGQVVGQVNAEINLPNLLATVFTTTRRERGEVPFAVDKSGKIYTPTEEDRAKIVALGTEASRPDTPPGTSLLQDWVVVTAADPTGSELKFGIARPMGDALDELRRSSARDAGLGLGLISLALIGIVPLSSRLTRNLSRLSEGVNRIAKGDYRARVEVKTHDETGKLAEAFNRMAADVERHQRAAVEQERLRRELELGRQIQHDMLPQAPLRLGLMEVRGVSVPATEVGGDFFNYFQTPSGQIALLVGDVSGKGVGAALLMANIQASLRARLALGQDLAALARELDADIAASTPGAVYATLFVGLLDPDARLLAYVNAGHNPQYLLRRDGTLERMESTGLPIGLLAGHGYTERRVSLSPGDLLFFYTDGCVEADNASGEMFGNARLEKLLTSAPAGSVDDMLIRSEEEIRTFRSGREPFDDATMMVVRVG